MPAPAKYKKEYAQIAGLILSKGDSIAAVCAEIEITRQTFYDWKKIHPEFADAVEIGLLKAQVVWETIGRGGIEGHYEKFGATPWIFTMKNRFREDYKEDKEDKKDDEKSVLEKILSGEIKIKHD